MSASAGDDLEGLLTRFDEQCRSGAPRLAALLAMAVIDLERRLAAGEDVRVERLYLEPYPELRGDRDAALRLIACEWELRRRRESDLSADEFLSRFPEHRGELEQRLAAAVPSLPHTAVTPPRAEAVSPPAVPGCLLEERIGRGGMGEVYRGRDPELRRDLAVKVMRPECQASEDLRQRFIAEAQIGGQLQHPGVLPVYRLGATPDGRPFFTMKLIKGQSLAALLSQGPADVGRLLGAFEQICQAIAYAHSRRVIHRDLKPDNVMVGDFGEVQVIDWGLAKKLAAGDESAERPDGTPGTVIETVRSDSDPANQTGAAGTFAYAAPEQVRGEAGVDERADVFGLGAILCEILTGKPPYAPEQAWQVRGLAERGDLAEAFARLDACGAEAALAALCKGCLSAERERRPRDAGALAERVAAYRAEVQQRLRRAELERAAAEARAEAEQLARAEAEARVDAEQRARLAAETRQRAERQRRRLVYALGGLAAVFVGVLLGGGWWLDRKENQARADRERQEAAVQSERERREEEARWNLEARLARIARLRDQGRWSDARAECALAERQVADGDERRRVEQARLDLEFAARLESARVSVSFLPTMQFEARGPEREYERAFEQGGFGRPGDAPEEFAARVRASVLKPHLTAALEDWFRTSSNNERKRWLRAVLARIDPDPLADEIRTAHLDRDRDRLEKLIAHVEVKRLSPTMAVLLAESHAAAFPLLKRAALQHPGDFWLALGCGVYLSINQKKFTEAEGYLQAAVAIRGQSSFAWCVYGMNFYWLKKYEEAIQAFRRATELDRGLAIPHFLLGSALDEAGRREEAIRSVRRAEELDPSSPSPPCLLARLHLDKGDNDEAARCATRAIRLDPKDCDAYSHLGQALTEKEEYDEAIKQLKKAVGIDPKHVLTRNNLGYALIQKEAHGEAVIHLSKAVELDPEHVNARSNLGQALVGMGRNDEAIEHLEKAVELDPKHVNAWNNLGWACLRKGEYDRAVKRLKKALELDPDHVNANSNLGRALIGKGEYDDAIPHLNKAVSLDPKHGAARNNLGWAYYARGEWAKARSVLQEAIDRDPKYVWPHVNLAHVCNQTGRPEEAITHLKAALAIDPKLERTHSHLRIAYRETGDLTRARQACRLARELAPKNTSQSRALTQSLAEIEGLLCLEADLPPAGEEEVKSNGFEESLRLARLCRIKKRHAQAVRIVEAAAARDPEAAATMRSADLLVVARACSRAAAGEGEGAPAERDRPAYRDKALAWLRRYLKAHQGGLEKDHDGYRYTFQANVRLLLHHCDLEPFRPPALAALPEDERKNWLAFWSDVEKLLSKADRPLAAR
jgi:tetratricopeptide (TPR) repeat protein